MAYYRQPSPPPLLPLSLLLQQGQGRAQPYTLTTGEQQQQQQQQQHYPNPSLLYTHLRAKGDQHQPRRREPPTSLEPVQQRQPPTYLVDSDYSVHPALRTTLLELFDRIDATVEPSNTGLLEHQKIVEISRLMDPSTTDVFSHPKPLIKILTLFKIPFLLQPPCTTARTAAPAALLPVLTRAGFLRLFYLKLLVDPRRTLANLAAGCAATGVGFPSSSDDGADAELCPPGLPPHPHAQSLSLVVAVEVSTLMLKTQQRMAESARAEAAAERGRRVARQRTVVAAAAAAAADAETEPRSPPTPHGGATAKRGYSTAAVAVPARGNSLVPQRAAVATRRRHTSKSPHPRGGGGGVVAADAPRPSPSPANSPQSQLLQPSSRGSPATGTTTSPSPPIMASTRTAASLADLALVATMEQLGLEFRTQDGGGGVKLGLELERIERVIK
ncbi:hypothetical protein DFJ73DRAFT_783229 [Zopfochytrium polystomum]|nr:hypothetical protein DFJ73DRAFT_783229 [Zopfochytrium polystomum]